MNAVLLLLAAAVVVGVRSVSTNRPVRPTVILAMSFLCVVALYSHRVVN